MSFNKKPTTQIPTNKPIKTLVSLEGNFKADIYKRLQFDQTGNKVPTGSPYVQLASTTRSIVVNDIKELKKIAEGIINPVNDSIHQMESYDNGITLYGFKNYRRMFIPKDYEKEFLQLLKSANDFLKTLK